MGGGACECKFMVGVLTCECGMVLTCECKFMVWVLCVSSLCVVGGACEC